MKTKLKQWIRYWLYKFNLITSWDYYGLNDATVGALHVESVQMWHAEKSRLLERIKNLESRCEKLRERNGGYTPASAGKDKDE